MYWSKYWHRQQQIKNTPDTFFSLHKSPTFHLQVLNSKKTFKNYSIIYIITMVMISEL